MAKEREDIKACGLAKAEADATQRAAARGVFRNVGNERAEVVMGDFLVKGT
jgi:hypothetical protein